MPTGEVVAEEGGRPSVASTPGLAPPRPRPFQGPRLAMGASPPDVSASPAQPTSAASLAPTCTSLPPPRIRKQKPNPPIVCEIDWNPENTTIICKLFAEQVKKRNRSNTHMNSIAFEEIETRFKERTGLQANKTQIKNKWDKLKEDLKAWRKLMRRQTGTGWDNVKGTIVMEDEWWAKARKDIPGCGKFKKQGLQNEELLEEMFGDITNDGGDHWSPMCPNFESSPLEPINLESQEEEEDLNVIHGAAVGDKEVEDISPTYFNGKRRSNVLGDKGKKPTTGTAASIQDALTRIADSATALASKKEPKVTIKEVMQHVLDCGATFESNEYYIATDLFVKKDQREMFMQMPPGEIRFNWLKRKYNEKFDN